MESKSFFEPINLLVIAENDTLRRSFIGDLQGFLQNKDYKPPQNLGTVNDNNAFTASFREFFIISSPILGHTEAPKNISLKTQKFQDQFLQPLNINAIIFLQQPDPTCYEQCLSLNLLNYFSKDDIAKIEENLIFVFAHDNPVSYQKSYKVDADLWNALDRIGVDLLHPKTFHYHSRLDKDGQEAVLQFVYRIKRTLVIENLHLHESVLKVVGNEDILELLMDALFANEDNIHYEASGEKKEYTFSKYDTYRTMCTNQKCLYRFQVCCSCSNVKTKPLLGTCDALINKITCTICKCSVQDHKAVFYTKYKTAYTGRNKTKYRQTLLTMIVIIDLFLKENNASVSPLSEIMKERIKQETRYSVLETVYKNVMEDRQKGITADDCMKCILSLLPNLEGFQGVFNFFKNSFMSAERHLRVTDKIRQGSKA